MRLLIPLLRCCLSHIVVTHVHRSIGYGDITATTIFEMTMAVLVMLIGIVVFGSVIGLLSNLLFNTPNRQRRLDNHLQSLLKDAEEFLYLYRHALWAHTMMRLLWAPLRNRRQVTSPPTTVFPIAYVRRSTNSFATVTLRALRRRTW